jgi:hypothetical protein
LNERRAIVKRITLFAVAVALVAGVGAASPAATQTDSGLTGKVLRGPTTPVCRDDKPCYASFKGTLVFTPVTTAGTAPVTPVREQTAPDGTYRVLLEPARYRVATGARSRFGNAVKPATVTVPQKGMRRVNFIVDTGIR